MNRSEKLMLIIVVTAFLLACNLPVTLPPTLTPMLEATNTPIPEVTNTPIAIPTSTPSPTSVPTEMPLYQSVWLESIDHEESGEAPDYTLTTHTPVMKSDGDFQQVQNFNALTTAFVQHQVGVFQEMLADSPAKSILTGSYYEISFAQLSPAGNLISLQFIVDGFMDGAAHPFRMIHSFNYDLEVGQEIQLEALFTPGVDYLQVISNYCIAELSNRDIGAWLEGAAPTSENYRVWNITAEGLLITFNEYQVAAYAAGPQTVNVPYTVLQDLLIPEVIP